MGRGTRYLESSATEEEDSYGYRVEWDDCIVTDFDRVERKFRTIHKGSGKREVSGFDNAWDVFNDYSDSLDYIGVRLIQVFHDGSERVYASK